MAICPIQVVSILVAKTFYSWGYLPSYLNVFLILSYPCSDGLVDT